MKAKAKTTTPPKRSVEDYALDLSDKFLHCRELGHNWRPHTVRWDSDARCYDRRLRCASCRTIRIQLLTDRGHVVSNRYKYPEMYLAEGVEQATNRDAFRVEAVRRFLEPKLQEVS